MILKFYAWFMMNIISPFSWGKIKKFILRRKFEGNLQTVDHMRIKEVLSGGHYIILIRRSTHFTTFLIGLGHYLLGIKAYLRHPIKAKWPNFGFWSHALINIEDTTTPQDDSDFMLVEAVGKGVKVSGFLEVFDCDAVKILAPMSNVTGEIRPWQIITERVFADIGKPYDLKFNLKDDKTMSCVEFVYDTLKNDSLYCYDFKNLTDMIELYGNLDPDMFDQANCFKTILELRR